MLVGKKNTVIQQTSDRTNGKISLWVLAYVCIYIGLFMLDLYMASSYIKESGYLGFYIYNQMKVVDPSMLNRLSGYMTTLLPVVFGYSYIFHYSRLEKRLLFFTFFISAFSLALIGQRGMLFCLLLLSISLYTKKKKISLVKFSVMACLLVILAQVLFLLRSEGLNTNISLSSLLGSFFHQQGVSFIVYELSKLYSFPDYLSYQVFIPGLNFMLDIFNLGSAEQTFKFFGDYLAFTVNTEEYAQGKGLGWTLVGDFEQILGWGDFGVLVGMILFGAMLGYLDKSRYKDIQFIKYSLFLNILFLPRSSLQNLLIPIVACVCILLIRKLIMGNFLLKIRPN
ncbi:O-antigen polysaccharide polymerase Wzy [Pelistega indica]|nr:O-antigen polysaccharide polymerase Wzy [Pelistega indica]